MLTQNQVQDSRTEQVVKYQIQTKRQTSHTRHAIKKRETSVTSKKEKQTKPVYHQRERKHKPYTREKNHTPKRQKKKRKTTRHIPALTHHLAHRPTIQSPAPHTQPSSYSYPHSLSTSLLSPIPTPYPHTDHTSTNTFLHTYAHPATAHRHCTTIRVYILARNCIHACLGLATARPQLVFRSLTVATPSTACCSIMLTCTATSHRCLHTCSHVCLHYCARLLQHHAYRLGFSPCAHHSPSFSPFMCHPSHLRYHQSLTRVHSHSLPVPPPLPLADARSQGGSTVGRSRSLACGLWCPLVLCGSPCW